MKARKKSPWKRNYCLFSYSKREKLVLYGGREGQSNHPPSTPTANLGASKSIIACRLAASDWRDECAGKSELFTTVGLINGMTNRLTDWLTTDGRTNRAFCLYWCESDYIVDVRESMELLSLLLLAEDTCSTLIYSGRSEVFFSRRINIYSFFIRVYRRNSIYFFLFFTAGRKNLQKIVYNLLLLCYNI